MAAIHESAGDVVHFRCQPTPFRVRRGNEEARSTVFLFIGISAAVDIVGQATNLLGRGEVTIDLSDYWMSRPDGHQARYIGAWPEEGVCMPHGFGRWIPAFYISVTCLIGPGTYTVCRLKE